MNVDTSRSVTICRRAAELPPASRERGRADVESRDIVGRHLRQESFLGDKVNDVSASPPNHVFRIKAPSHYCAALNRCSEALEVLLPFAPGYFAGFTILYSR